MRRMLLIFVVILGAAVALEPVIHTHPLTQSSTSTQCAVCVNAHARVTSLAPAPASPLVPVGEVSAPRLPAQPASIATALTSRAPPAA